MPKKLNNFAPVVKGRKLTADQLRADVVGLDDVDISSDVDLQIVRLLALNPNLKKVQFRSLVLSDLDDATKRDLLQDINDVLGIKPLRKRR